MHNVIKGLVVCLAINGLGFAADVPSGTGSSGGGNTGTNSPTNSAPRSGGAQGSGTAPGISPSGSGVTDRGVTPRGDAGTTGISGTANTTTGETVGTSMTGTVESVDRSGNRVRIRDAQGRVTEFKVSDQTSFSSNGQRSRFSRVNTGDTVTFETTPDQQGISKFDFGTTRKQPTTTR